MRFSPVSQVARCLKISTAPESNQKRARVNRDSERATRTAVMPGLVPGIHVVPGTPLNVDGRDEPGHDSGEWGNCIPSVIPGRCAASNPESRRCGPRRPSLRREIPGSLALRAPRNDGVRQRPRYCVFGECGLACATKWVASSIAVPSGVGTTMRNGTRKRVPGIGANAISILRCDCRYLITGRSGI